MMMKKWWIAVLLAMAMMATACGSGSSSDNAGKQVSESKDDEQETIEYEEFERLAMTFELPVGTTEEEGQAGTRYFYRNEDLYVMLERELKFQLDDATFAEYLANIAEGFEGKTSKTKKMKIDGFQGYQADIDGKVNDEPMVMTLVSFNVPIGFISFLVTDQTTDKADYEEILDNLVASIKVDKETYEKATQSDYYVKGNVAVTEGCTIKITGSKVFQPGEGWNAYGSKPTIAIEYDMTNTGNTEITPAVEWPFIVTVVQDNDPNTVNTLNSGTLIGAPGVDLLLQKIKAGGTVHCTHGYELTDTTTPVQLIIKNGVAGEELGKITLNIQ